MNLVTSPDWFGSESARTTRRKIRNKRPGAASAAVVSNLSAHAATVTAADHQLGRMKSRPVIGGNPSSTVLTL